MSDALQLLAGAVVVLAGFVLSSWLARRHVCTEWEPVGVEYEPPASEVDFRGRLAPPWLADVAYGFSTVTERCGGCGTVRTRVCRGRVDLGPQRGSA